MTVVGVAVNWLGANVLYGQDVHLPIIRGRVEGHDVHLTIIQDGMEGQDVHLSILWDGMEGQDMHFPVVRDGRGRNAFDGDRLGVVGVTVVLDGRVSFDLVETEQLPETIGDSDCGTAQGVAWATTGLDGRNNLNAIQPIVAGNGRSGWAVEKLAGRAYFIIGRD